MRVQAEENRLEGEIEWFLDHLAGERAASAHTVAAYERDLRQMTKCLTGHGVTSFSEMDGDAAAKVRSEMAGYAPSSIQRKLSALRSIVRFLARRAGKSPDRLPSTGGLRKQKTLPKALTEDEMERLSNRPDLSTPSGLRDRAIIELLYGGGLRVSELVSLRMEDYASGESLLRVLGKREKVRILPLPAQTHGHLRNYLEHGRNHLRKSKTDSTVFLNHSGNAFSRSGIFRMLRKYAAMSGIDKEIGPHTLRHTYAVHLVKNGADLRSVQELLGHASIMTTEVYTHLDMETIKEKYTSAHPRAKRKT